MESLAGTRALVGSAMASSRRVDIVGDFTGKHLFGIHGESMVAHCLKQACVDYQGAFAGFISPDPLRASLTCGADGFQLLHAVHSVERFLDDLQERGCNFHILWFDDTSPLSVPQGENAHRSKYLLTRLILIEHLKSHSNTRHLQPGFCNGRISFDFPSSTSPEFRARIAQNPLHLIMCAVPEKEASDQYLMHTLVLNRFAHLGSSIAFINNVEFRSSKVYADVVTALQPLSVSPNYPLPNSQECSSCPTVLLQLSDRLDSHTTDNKVKLSTRERIGLITCATIAPSSPEATVAFLVHLNILTHTKLAQRSYKSISVHSARTNYFLEQFASIASNLIRHWSDSPDKRWTRVDLFDIIDGRLFGNAWEDPQFQMCGIYNLHLEILEKLLNTDVKEQLKSVIFSLPSPSPFLASADAGSHSRPATPSVLPFSHPVVDGFLQDVRLETHSPTGDSKYSQVFKELTHWHNAKKALDQTRPNKPLGFFARKRNQKYMADTIAYSASLTNASGKNIEPEQIVVETPQPGNSKNNRQTWNQGESKKLPKRPSGKQAAHEAAKQVAARKTLDKASAVVGYWQKSCQEFQAEGSRVTRYLKAVKYLRSLSKPDMEAIGAEVSLYCVQALSNLLVYENDLSSVNKLSILALAWSHLFEVSNWSASTETAKGAQKLAGSLKLSLGQSLQPSLSRQLPFTVSLNKLSIPWPRNETEYHLEYRGPYLDRSFDATPDPRVPFIPDAWQRKVLDAIDQNNSLFVIAPTSAGKTFISFYAMKKILQSNDDDVLVYVAPTKALVNQIAAEIQARFSKSYKYNGKSVWAIHTRDYRVNSATGCQILVTVPHVLQIMLLAPSNAQKPNSWSYRVKRIIFDEVHCIGQGDDGIVWEQLLLTAPCPIIALSATVGNPTDLQDWLAETQRMKGHKLVMVVHSTRYSDLRKFIYNTQGHDKFEGFKDERRLPLAGLDAEGTGPFSFIHPVATMLSRDVGTLHDLGLEPRDCLQLWKAMDLHQNKDFPLSPSLSPAQYLPPVPKKADIIRWEIALKQKLEGWMMDSQSPFAACLRHLQDPVVPNRSKDERPRKQSSDFVLLADLRKHGGLPAIVFNYDRHECEEFMNDIVKQLVDAEKVYKETNLTWRKKMETFEKWRHEGAKTHAKKSRPSKQPGLTKADLLREEASREQSPFASFDPLEPLAEFSFADTTKISRHELRSLLAPLKNLVHKRFIIGIQRGSGVHHAGMNREYRQVVELLFRRSFLTVVVATGTLALGINMPCKTVVFSGDSPYLTALNYRQASGRAGRRSFDLLGNVVFHKIQRYRAMEIMSSRLPDLRGTFPISVTLILRLFTLLHGSKNSEYATQVVQSLFTQTRLYLGGPNSRWSIKHHLRFSIEYLRQQDLLSATGEPLNFAGLVCHLYFTENAVFAFHSLLRSGYLHELCADVGTMAKRKDTLLELMLLLCHLFGRIPCVNYRSKELQDRAHRSPSNVFLPALPDKAAEILHEHNRNTLDIFISYVHSYVQQHLSSVDDKLPFTNRSTIPENAQGLGNTAAPCLPRTIIRSPFSALSGMSDEFQNIHELVKTVRAGVFLDESAIPFIPIFPNETNNVPWNAYLLDFFKHGDVQTLARDNGIRRGDVWFLLKDFSLVLATIVASLEQIVKPGVDYDDAGIIEEQEPGNELEDAQDSQAESTEHEGSDFSNGSYNSDAVGITKVYLAFKILQLEFEAKFRAMWS